VSERRPRPLARASAGAGSGDGLTTAFAGGLGFSGVAGGSVLLVQYLNVDGGLSHDMSFTL